MMPTPKARVLAAAGLGSAGRPTAPIRPLAGSADGAWLIRLDHANVVLKRCRPGTTEAEIVWEHAALGSISGTFPHVPAPVPLFRGRSWLAAADRIWSATTFLAGQTLDREPAPDLEAAGGLLAAYHQAVLQRPGIGQRPGAVPLTALAARLPAAGARHAFGSADALASFRRRVTETIGALGARGITDEPRLVVHGDATLHNMVTDGMSPVPTGLIDFGAAYRDVWPIDLGASLWRTGRREDDDIALAPERVGTFLAGYHRVRPLEHGHALAVPLLVEARGFQLIVKRLRRATRAGRATIDTARRRLDWLHAHRAALEDAIIGALQRERTDR